MLALRGVFPLIGVVVYRPGKVADPLLDAAKELFGLEEIEVRGLGNAYRYETPHASVYFVPIKQSYEIHAREMEKQISEAIGRPDVVISINPHLADMREGMFIHSAGNITGKDVLGANYVPRSVSPTEPGVIGLMVRAAHAFADELNVEPRIHIEATHDFPVDATIPYLSFELRGRVNYELAALTLIAALGKRVRFKPYLSIGMSYYANEFFPVILHRKKVPAYHVPYYLAHNLNEDAIRELVKKGYIKGLAFGRGVPREKLPF
jgi:D-tyrosyl-tRNA(Tyr) deacylase